MFIIITTLNYSKHFRFLISPSNMSSNILILACIFPQILAKSTKHLGHHLQFATLVNALVMVNWPVFLPKFLLKYETVRPPFTICNLSQCISDGKLACLFPQILAKVRNI